MQRPSRQALRYIIRNTTFPQRVRAQAQLQLSQMHCYTRFTQIKNRCIMGGRGRGILSDFRLGRVRPPRLVRWANAYCMPVPIPSQRARRKPARSEEGQLVGGGGKQTLERGRTCTKRVYTIQNKQHRVALIVGVCMCSNTDQLPVSTTRKPRSTAPRVAFSWLPLPRPSPSTWPPHIPVAWRPKPLPRYLHSIAPANIKAATHSPPQCQYPVFSALGLETHTRQQPPPCSAGRKIHWNRMLAIQRT